MLIELFIQIKRVNTKKVVKYHIKKIHTYQTLHRKSYAFCFHLNTDEYKYYIKQHTGYPNICNLPKINPDLIPMISHLLSINEIDNIIRLYE